MVSTQRRSIQTRGVQTRHAQTRAVQTRAPLVLPTGGAQEFFFSDGLLGLSTYQHFLLRRYQPEDGSTSPFFLLNAKDQEEKLSLPCIEPFLFAPAYQLSPPVEVLALLQAGSLAEVAVLVIVTLRDRMEEITANLQGPLLLNPKAGLGLQLVVERFPVRHPLLAQGGGKKLSRADLFSQRAKKHCIRPELVAE